MSACSYHGFMGGLRTKNVKSDESTLNIVDLFDHTVWQMKTKRIVVYCLPEVAKLIDGPPFADCSLEYA